MSKKCSLCGEVLPDYCISDVEIFYKVNGQIVLNRRRKICGHCQSITVQELQRVISFRIKGIGNAT